MNEIITHAVGEALNNTQDYYNYKKLLANRLAHYLATEYQWIQEIWLADISGGIFLNTLETGKDMDLLIGGKPPKYFDIEYLERLLDAQVRKALELYSSTSNLVQEILRNVGTHNLIELHLNDVYVYRAKSRRTDSHFIYRRR